MYIMNFEQSDQYMYLGEYLDQYMYLDEYLD